jgi:hypothetical protein
LQELDTKDLAKVRLDPIRHSPLVISCSAGIILQRESPVVKLSEAGRLYAIITLLVVLTLSLAITRVAAVALTMTGLSPDVARFQARSAFTGVGFPTTEAEALVRHPVRREIISVLMLVHNVGLATVVATVVIGFLEMNRADNTVIRWVQSFAVLGVGLLVLWLIASSRWIDRRMSSVIRWALSRFTELDARDYVALLHLRGEYAVKEMRIGHDHWLLVRKTLQQAELPREGILVLGIERANGTYIGAPNGETLLEGDDRLILYGPTDRITELVHRRADLPGAMARVDAEEEYKKRREIETKADAQSHPAQPSSTLESSADRDLRAPRDHRAANPSADHNA